VVRAATSPSLVSGASLEPNVKQFRCGCRLPLFGLFDVCCPIALRIKAGKTNQKFLTI